MSNDCPVSRGRNRLNSDENTRAYAPRLQLDGRICDFSVGVGGESKSKWDRLCRLQSHFIRVVSVGNWDGIPIFEPKEILLKNPHSEEPEKNVR